MQNGVDNKIMSKITSAALDMNNGAWTSLPPFVTADSDALRRHAACLAEDGRAQEHNAHHS